jgi:Cys-rich repeat protein
VFVRLPVLLATWVLAVSGCKKSETRSVRWSAEFVDSAASLLYRFDTVGDCQKTCSPGDCAEATPGSGRHRWVCVIQCARDSDCPGGQVCNCGTDMSRCDTPLIGPTAKVCVTGDRVHRPRPDAGSREMEQAVILTKKVQAELARRGARKVDGGPDSHPASD